jgi:hypothetical protein
VAGIRIATLKQSIIKGRSHEVSAGHVEEVDTRQDEESDPKWIVYTYQAEFP